MNDTTVKMMECINSRKAFSAKVGEIYFPFVPTEGHYCLFINDSNRHPLAKSFINYKPPRLGKVSYISPICYASDNIENLFRLASGALDE